MILFIVLFKFFLRFKRSVELGYWNGGCRNLPPTFTWKRTAEKKLLSWEKLTRGWWNIDRKRRKQGSMTLHRFLYGIIIILLFHLHTCLGGIVYEWRRQTDIIYTYRTSLDKSDGMTVLYFAIIILLAVDLLNKSLKHFRRAIIVVAAYMESCHFLYPIYSQLPISL